MKKFFYFSFIAIIGLVASCGNANNSSTSEDIVVEEVATDCVTKDAKCCGGTKEDCASKNEGVEHNHDHDHDHDHNHGDDEEHSHNR